MPSPCLLPEHTALALGRGLGLPLHCSRGCSGSVTAPGAVHCQEDREHQGQRLSPCCVLSCDVGREEGKGGKGREFTSEQPFRAFCCMALALLPDNALAAPCPGVPSSASSALQPDLFLQSPAGSGSARAPPVLLWVLLHPRERNS